jgi:ketol-acid reductoisomerase
MRTTSKPLVVYRDNEASLDQLKGKTVVVIGYGNQGRAQALNLRDSGVNVLVAGVQDSRSVRAESDGFRVIPISSCAQKGEVLMLLIPDEVQRKVYEESLASDLRAGHTLCFGHGYNYHYGLIRPPANVDVILVAPRMIGAVVRRAFEHGKGVPAYVAVGQDGSGKAKDIMLAIAKGIGSTRPGAAEMTFESETILDLFVEQAILPIFIKSMVWGFEILTEAGFDPGIITLEMWGSGEIAEVFKACAETGFFKQMQFHSRTAQYGELTRGETMLPESVKRRIREELESIQTGAFAREWAAEERASFPCFNALMAATEKHPINEAERQIAQLVDLGSSL